MKDKNRADDWTDDSKSRLFGFLKYRRNRKMKHDRQSKTRLRDIHIKNMKLHEEFVTEFSVDAKYKAWLDSTYRLKIQWPKMYTLHQSLKSQLIRGQSY